MKLRRITDRLWYLPENHATDRPCLGYIRGERGALMFDVGNSPAHAALYAAAVQAAGLPAACVAALSHWHWDHTYAIDAIKVPVFAGAQTAAKLAEMTGWVWDEAAMAARVAAGQEIPFCHAMLHAEYENCEEIRLRCADVVFEGEVTIDLGGVHCRLIHVGGPHSADSVICHVPEERFVFLGDSAGKDLYGQPWQYDPAHPEHLEREMAKIPYDAQKLAAYRQVLQGLDFTMALEGHAPPTTAEAVLGFLR